MLSQIQMQLTLKLETFPDFFVRFMESISNFKYFEKQDDRHSYFITEFMGSDRLGYIIL